MKRQLNLICVLIFLFVGLSLLPSAYMMGSAFVEGFKAGMSQAETLSEPGTAATHADMLSPLALDLWPKSWISTPDRLFNRKDGEWYPASHVKTMIWAKAENNGVARYASLFALAGLFFILKAIVQFYKLINAINHEVIFDWMNVCRLNRIGRNLLLSFVMTQVYMLANYWAISHLFEPEGYELNFWGDFQSMTLIMGLVSLLVGRIFAIGLQMKEEQELTI